MPGISPITESNPNRKSVPGILNRLSIQFVIDSSPRNSGGNGFASTRFIACLLSSIVKTFVPPQAQRLLLWGKPCFSKTRSFSTNMASKQESPPLEGFLL
jgi:hypothetical protein